MEFEIKETTLLGIIAILLVSLFTYQALRPAIAPVVIPAAGGVQGFNSEEEMMAAHHGGSSGSPATGGMVGSCGTGGSSASGTQLEFDSEVIPKGVPAVYGAELGISFDDVSSVNPQKADATLTKLGSLENKISLSGSQLQKYVRVLSNISCEYCCGADSIITREGEPACGCAHSGAMRGLAKYLIKNHDAEFNDEQLLEELGKWKTLFFPAVMSQKAQVLKEKGIEFNYINLASNKYRGIENGATGGGMVGGC